VGFDVTDQLLIRSFAFVRYWRKDGSATRQYISYDSDSVRRDVLYNIIIEIGVPMKLFSLIKICLNEAYSKVHICKYLKRLCITQSVNNALLTDCVIHRRFSMACNRMLKYRIAKGKYLSDNFPSQNGLKQGG
jgi:hypothetical protein